MLRTALRALAARFDGMPELNLWTTARVERKDQFHWHIDIAPRIGIRAGFEMSTGVELDVFPPERAAANARPSAGRARCSAAAGYGEAMIWISSAVFVLFVVAVVFFFVRRWRSMARHGRVAIPCDQVVQLPAGWW